MSENNAALTFPVFKMLSTPNEIESKKQGRPVYDDQEVCEIRFSGNKQTIGVFPAHEQCEWAVDAVTQERTRITYAQKYNDQYLKFKAGEAQAAHGTPLEELPFLTQGKRLELKALNIYTAEALAALDGNPLKMLGMGGRDLKSQAQLYLDAAAKTVDMSQLAADNERLRKQVEELLAGQQSKPTKTTKRKPVVEEPPPGEADDAVVDPDNPFNDWDVEDVTAWIKDADPAFEIDGRWGKETLAAKAKELNDKIAAAKG